MQREARRLFGKALLLGVAAALLAAAGAGAAGAKKDIVNGGFQDYFGEHVGLHAASGPAGENPSGHESATTPGGNRYRLRVACLTVEGNVAAYGTVVVKSNDPDFPPGSEFVEVVRDGGLPGGAGDGWDLFDEPADECADFLADAASAPAILSGNISIRDAQA